MCKDKTCDGCPDDGPDCLLKDPRIVRNFFGMDKTEIPLEKLIGLLSGDAPLSPELKKMIQDTEAAGGMFLLLEFDIPIIEDTDRKVPYGERVRTLDFRALYQQGVEECKQNILDIVEWLVSSVSKVESGELVAGVHTVCRDVRNDFLQVRFPVWLLHEALSDINSRNAEIQVFTNTLPGGRIAEIGLKLAPELREKILSSR